MQLSTRGSLVKIRFATEEQARKNYEIIKTALIKEPEKTLSIPFKDNKQLYTIRIKDISWVRYAQE